MVCSVKPLINVSIIGCGDIGCRVGLQLKNDFQTNVTGYARSDTSIARMSMLSIGSKEFDLDSLEPETCNSLSQFKDQHVFYFAPPPPQGSKDTRMLSWLAALDTENLPQRILYISTTGVYGNHQGKLIDETAQLNPQTERAKRRLDAEQALSQFALQHSIDYIILRVPGIYGENRLPRKRLLEQIPVLYPELSPVTNRIHEDDLANICVTAALKSNSGEIYNISDGDNMTMSEYFINVARYLNIPVPSQIDWTEAEQTLSKGMLSYLKESRLIDNRKILNTLSIKLKYPNLSTFLNYTKF